jgi:hypothetical protein
MRVYHLKNYKEYIDLDHILSISEPYFVLGFLSAEVGFKITFMFLNESKEYRRTATITEYDFNRTKMSDTPYQLPSISFIDGESIVWHYAADSCPDMKTSVIWKNINDEVQELIAAWQTKRPNMLTNTHNTV